MLSGIPYPRMTILPWLGDGRRAHLDCELLLGYLALSWFWYNTAHKLGPLTSIEESFGSRNMRLQFDFCAALGPSSTKMADQAAVFLSRPRRWVKQGALANTRRVPFPASLGPREYT